MRKYITIFIGFISIFITVVRLTSVSSNRLTTKEIFDYVVTKKAPGPSNTLVPYDKLPTPSLVEKILIIAPDSDSVPTNKVNIYGLKNSKNARQDYVDNGGKLRVENNGILIEFMNYNQKGKPRYLMTFNVDAATSANITPVVQAPYHLDGASEVVGVWDGGSAMSTHVDFNNGGTVRLLVNDGSAIHWHSTHVAGTIASSGANAPLALGMSPVSRVVSYDWNSDLDEMASIAARTADHTDHIYLSNHSYGVPTGWASSPVDGVRLHWYGDLEAVGRIEDKDFGNYDANAMELDDLTNAFPYLLPFVSAGNDRGKVPASGELVSYYDSSSSQNKTIAYDEANHPKGNNHKGGYDTISHAGLAKNIITVGAVNDAVNDGLNLKIRSIPNATMSSFSCWGPCDDGRIKPDLVANGVDLFSSYYDPERPERNDLYAYATGTSMATPSLTGSANLIQSYYLQRFGSRLLGASLKALLIHTADDLGNEGPDYINGWGLVNVHEAVKVIDSQVAKPFTPIIREDKIFNNEMRSYTIYSSGLEPLKVTIVWNDVAGTSFHPNDLDVANNILINDLDLKVVDASNTTSLPWVLDVVLPSSPATKGDNVVDNVEQVFIPTPSEGVYSVQISHKGLLKYGRQNFSVITSGCSVLAKEIPNLTVTHDSKNLLLNEYPSIRNGGDLGSFHKSSGRYLKKIIVTNNRTGSASISNVSVVNSQHVSVFNSPPILEPSASGEIDLIIDTDSAEGVVQLQLVVEIDSQSYSFDLQYQVTSEVFPNSNWSSAWIGEENWIIDRDVKSSDSIDSLRSKEINNSEEVALTYSGLLEAGVVSFQMKASTERDWDYFTFQIDGVSQILVQESSAKGISGEMGWIRFSQNISAGNHTFTWKYKKDGWASRGYDAVWIDEVIVPNLTSQHKVTFLASGEGYISGDLIQDVDNGTNCSQLTATALPGYKFDYWEGGSITRTKYSENPLTVTNVTGSSLYTAHFVNILATPTVELVLQKDGLTITWTVTDETNLDEYRLVNATTGAILHTVKSGSGGTYSFQLQQEVDIKLIIVDLNSGEQVFIPPFDSNEIFTEYNLKIGWNLIAIVGDLADMSEFTSVKRGHIWGWDNGVYVPVIRPNACDGFWIYSESEKLVTVVSRKSDLTMPNEFGWNLVGPKEDRYKPASVSVIFSWDVSYEPLLPDVLMTRGTGYWSFVSTDPN